MKDRAILVGDAAGYVTKCSGEGIYFAAKSGRMCAETIVHRLQSSIVLARGVSSWRFEKYDVCCLNSCAVLERL